MCFLYKMDTKCEHLSFANPQFDTPAPAELLFGADVYPDVWENQGVSLCHGFLSTYSLVNLISLIEQGFDKSAQSMLVCFIII